MEKLTAEAEPLGCRSGIACRRLSGKTGYLPGHAGWETFISLSETKLWNDPAQRRGNFSRG